METKQCITCHEDKGIDQFAMEGPGGKFRRNKCRSCVRKWNALPKEERDRIKSNETHLIRTRVEKICPLCTILKPREAFYHKSDTSDYMTAYCKLCDDAGTKARGKSNYIKHLKDGSVITEVICNWCTETKPVGLFARNRHRANGLDSTCKQCKKSRRDELMTDARHTTRLLTSIRSKCNKYDLPFDLTIEDLIIPEYCPVLNIKLSFGGSDNNRDDSPSVDRIIPKLGYVKGNIIVVSYRANRIKNDATVDELMTIAQFYKGLVNC